MRPCPIVSVIIPGWNESHLSATVLEHVIRTADINLYELIFVDDGSTDNTQQIVSRFPNVKYIKHSENRGVPCAWNTGIKEATGDYVIILNNDIQISDEHWMSNMVNAMKGRKVLVGAEYVDFNSATEWNGKILPYLNGWCFGFPRRIFYELGLFDEEFTPGGMEDVEFCVRAVVAGYKLEQVNVRMQHMYAATRGKYLRSQMQAIAERNRQLFLQKMNVLLPKSLPKKIIFDCPGNMKNGWGAYDLERRGLGGAETALTVLTRELATRGHEVLVFNDIQHSDNGEGVKYFNRSEIPVQAADANVFVVFRSPSEFVASNGATKKLFWSCDQQTGGKYDRDIFPYVDNIICISDYHTNYFSLKFGKPSDSFHVIGCPVNISDYEPHIEKNINQFIFCSVPRRGLEYMPVIMAEIRKSLPEAELVITSDYTLWGSPNPDNAHFRPMFKHPNDKFLGKVDRKDLIQYQLASMAYPYPCTYEECFCIAVAECSAAGATPHTTDIGAVKQTVGNAGFIVGEPKGKFALDIAKSVLDNYGKSELMLQSIENSWRWSSVVIANKWIDLINTGSIQKSANELSPGEIAAFALPGKIILPNGDIISRTSSM